MRQIPTTTSVLLVVVLAVSSARAGEGEVVGRLIEDVLLADGNATDEVNQLLALGADQVRPVLARMLRKCRDRTSSESRHRLGIESLAAVLGGQSYSRQRFLPYGVETVVVAGYAFVVERRLWFSMGPSIVRQWKPPQTARETVREGGHWREPLKPRPQELLTFLVEGNEVVHRIIGHDTSARGVARALGDAARESTEIRTRLLSELGGDRLQARDRFRQRGALLAAIARVGGPRVREFLIEELKKGFAMPHDWYRRVRFEATAEGLREAGGEEMVLEAYEAIRDLEHPRGGSFIAYAGGEAFLRHCLESARSSPTAGNLASVLVAQRSTTPLSKMSVLEALDIGERVGRDEDHGAVREAGVGLVNEILWPFSVSQFGFTFSGTPSAETRESAGDERASRRGGGIGAFPGPLHQLALLREDVAAGRIRIAERREHRRPLFEETVSISWDGVWEPEPWEGPRPEWAGEPGYAERMEFTAARVDGEVRVKIRNTGDRAVAVNPLAFKYGRADRHTEVGGRGKDARRKEELYLRLGAPFRNLLCVVPPGAYVVLPPGGSRTFAYPLPADLAGDSRVFVRMRDTYRVDGRTAAARLVETPLIEMR